MITQEVAWWVRSWPSLGAPYELKTDNTEDGVKRNENVAAARAQLEHFVDAMRSETSSKQSIKVYEMKAAELDHDPWSGELVDNIVARARQAQEAIAPKPVVTQQKTEQRKNANSTKKSKHATEEEEEEEEEIKASCLERHHIHQACSTIFRAGVQKRERQSNTPEKPSKKRHLSKPKK